ncbi:MAG: VWA domain-containing protein [Blastocatellia bacterium]
MICPRRVVSVVLLAVALLVPSAAALAKDKEFKAITKHIENKYQARRTKIPLLGLANFAVRLIRPAGVKGFKLAVYENHDFSPRPNEVSFAAVMREAYAKGWNPLVQTYSKRDGGMRTFVYAREEGKDIKLAVVTFQEREAVVAEVKFNPDAAARFLQKPELLGKSLGGLKDNSNISAGFASPAATSNRMRRDSGYSADLSVLNKNADAPAATQPATQNAAVTTPAPAVRTEPAPSEPADSNAPTRTEAAPEKQPVKEDAVKVETRLVNLNVKAISSGGQPLSNLKAEDFTIYEDGIRQELSHFAPVTAPISLVMLLDLSGSTEKKIKEMKEAAQKFVAALKPNTRIAVGTFARRFKLITPFVTDRTELSAAIDSIRHSGGGTEYYKAMNTALDLLKDTGETRRVIVVLTDGVDNNLQHGPDPTAPEFDDLLARVSEEDVTIYPIYFDTENKLDKLGFMFSSSSGLMRRYAVARQQLDAVAEQTGGAMFTAVRAEDLHDAYQRVAAELQQLYSVAYQPDRLKHNGEFRKVTVRLSHEGAVAKTRRGYYDK